MDNKFKQMQRPYSFPKSKKSEDTQQGDDRERLSSTVDEAASSVVTFTAKKTKKRKSPTVNKLPKYKTSAPKILMSQDYEDPTPAETTIETEKKSVCLHENTILDSHVEICRDCGIEICNLQTNEQEWRDYDQDRNDEGRRVKVFKKEQNKGIKAELQEYDLCKKIIQRADEIYQSCTQGDIKRSKYRLGVIFACVYEAYKELDSPKTPEELKKIFKIEHKHMYKGILYVAMHSNKRKYTYINPTNYVPLILKKLNMKDECLDPIIEIYDFVKNKSDIISRSNPQSVSAALVYNYIKKQNIDMNELGLDKVFDLSIVTIKKISDEIDRIIV